MTIEAAVDCATLDLSTAQRYGGLWVIPTYRKRFVIRFKRMMLQNHNTFPKCACWHLFQFDYLDVFLFITPDYAVLDITHAFYLEDRLKITGILSALSRKVLEAIILSQVQTFLTSILCMRGPCLSYFSVTTFCNLCDIHT